MSHRRLTNPILRSCALFALLLASSAFGGQKARTVQPSISFKVQPTFGTTRFHNAASMFNLLTLAPDEGDLRFPGNEHNYFAGGSSTTVGPTEVVQNSLWKVGVYDKSTGAPIFYGTVSDFLGLPTTLYGNIWQIYFDPKVNRYFILLRKDLPDGSQTIGIGISDDSTAIGGWTVYKVPNSHPPLPGALSIDVLTWGINRDLIVFSGFVDGPDLTRGLGSIDKAKVVAGKTATVKWFVLPFGKNIQLTYVRDATRPVYGVSIMSPTSLRVFEVSRKSDGAVSATFADVDVPKINPLDYMHSIYSTDKILFPENETVLTGAAWHNDHLAATHAMGMLNGGMVTPTGIRWYDILLNNFGMSAGGTPTLYQAGNITDGPQQRDFFGAGIGFNGNGDIGLMFNASSKIVSCDILSASRLVGDPIGTMGKPLDLMSSPAVFDGTFAWSRAFVTQDSSKPANLWGTAMFIRSDQRGVSEIFRWNPNVPTSLYGVNVAQSEVLNGQPVKGSIELTRVAPEGGIKVFLVSNNPAVKVPPYVIIGAGQMKKSFDIETSAVSQLKKVTITAGYGSEQRTVLLTVSPKVRLYSLTVTKLLILATKTTTGIVQLNGPAPTGGCTVDITHTTPYATTPTLVTVPAGSTTATFEIGSTLVKSDEKPFITATLEGVSKSVLIRVRHAQIIAVNITPASVVGGSKTVVTVTVVLEAPVPEGTQIEASGGPFVKVPRAVTVPTGQSKVSFTVQHFKVTEVTTVSITCENHEQMTSTFILKPG